MTIKRWAAKRDEAEPAIVQALRAVGAQVEYLDYPCDLLVRWRGGLHLLEVDRARRNQKRASSQLRFLTEWEVPRVKTAEQALRAIGAMT